MVTVARLGGDEFVVVLEGVNDVDDVIFIANKLLVTLARPLEICGHEITITVSIGVSLYPDDGMDADELLKNAEDRKSTRLNSSHVAISYAVFCWKKKNIRVISRKSPI